MSDLVVTPGWYMALAAVLFVIGASGLLLRRNALVMFMAIELMLKRLRRDQADEAARFRWMLKQRLDALERDPS